jgi:CheY-like chemotaxis protein
MKIVVVEDDPLEADLIRKGLEQAFPDLAIDRISTESEFQFRLDSLTKEPPDVFIVDMMLRWAEPSENMPEPPTEVRDEGFWRAGLRCQRMLASREETQAIPVILYTVLEKSDIDFEGPSRNVIHLRKDSDQTALIRLIRASYSASTSQEANASRSVSTRDHVFVSYSHEDRAWLNKLQVMLKPLLRKRTIYLWDDTKIRPGSKWKDEITKALSSARVAVLLVSPNFLASEFIANQELPPLLDTAARKGLSILWIAVSHSMYRETEIANYQAANDPLNPLDSLAPPELNRVLVEICEKIKEAATTVLH